MEDIEQLYITLRNSNLTNKSFKEFIQLYQDDDYKSRVHDAVVNKGLYSNDLNTFMSDYSMPVAPTVPSITSITDNILKLGSEVFNKLSVKLNTPIDDAGKSEYQFNQEIKDIDEDVLNKINTQFNKIKEQSLKQRASLGETRPLNATNLVDLIQINPEQGITEEVLKKYKTALSKKEEVKINDTFTKENFPQKTIEDSPFPTPTWDNYYSDFYAGKANPKINGVGIHDHMFSGEYEDVSSTFNLDLTDANNVVPLKKYLTEAYPDYEFSILEEEKETKYGSYFRDVGVKMKNPTTGEEVIIGERFKDGYKTSNEIKSNIINFIDKNGINIDAYRSLYYKQNEKFKELDKITSLTSEQVDKLAKEEKNLLRDATRTDQEWGVFRPDRTIESLTTTTTITNPYKDELKNAEKLLNQQRKIEKELNPDKEFKDITDEDIRLKAVELILAQKTAEYKKDNLTNYLEANADAKQAAYRYYANAKSDRKNTNAIAAQLEFENVASKSEAIKNDYNFVESVLAG
tara:strand:+ start:1258 stop:2811 length:1554 start_codon:yes stop_codon:yes gene_type:complete